MWGEAERTGIIYPRDKNAQGAFINVCKYLMGGPEEKAAKHFSVVPMTRKEAISTN